MGERARVTAGVSDRAIQAVWATIAWMIGVCQWPLLALAPRTVLRMLRLLRPNGYGVSDHDFWGFDYDRCFRSWYSKVADDYRDRGRLGYAWNDGLGLRLDIRVYNNWATYWLLGALGHRGALLMGYGGVLVAVAAFGSHQFGWAVGIIAAISVGGGPLLVRSFTRLGKPELMWAGVGLGAVALGYSGHTVGAGLVWSLLAVVNTPAAVTLGLVAAPGFLCFALLEGTLLDLVTAGLPGVCKVAVRAIPALRTGVAGTVAKQQKFYLLPLTPTLDDLYVVVAFAAPVVVTAVTCPISVDATVWWQSGGVTTAFLLGVMILPGPALYYLNGRLLRINDIQSIDLALVQTCLGIALGLGSLAGVAVTVGLIYRHRGRYHTRFAVQDQRHYYNGPWAPWQVVVRGLIRVMGRVGTAKPFAYPASPTIRQFVDAIPPRVRYIVEQTGDEPYTTQYPSRPFFSWLTHLDRIKGCHNLTSLVTYTMEFELACKLLARFNADASSPANLSETADRLGASHVLVYSDTTKAALESHGFAQISTIVPSALPKDECHRLFEPPEPPFIVLMVRQDGSGGAISPATRYRYHRSALLFRAKAGVDYLIRHRFEPNFAARQAGRRVELRPEPIVAGCPTSFMRLRAPADGPVRIWFRGSLI